MRPGDQSDGQISFFGTIEYQLDPDLNIQHPLLRDGLNVWDDLKGARPMPSPVDIDPLGFPTRLLPHISLLDIEYQPTRRFRWRLIGTYITEILGRDSTGRYWDEIYDSRAMKALSQGPIWSSKTDGPSEISAAPTTSIKPICVPKASICRCRRMARSSTICSFAPLSAPRKHPDDQIAPATARNLERH